MNEPAASPSDQSLEDFEDELAELSSAEDFLEYFEVPFDQKVVHVNRLHILQRYHDYLAQGDEMLPSDPKALAGVHRALLTRAYEDFVNSNAQAEKVFKVFKEQEQKGFVSLDSIAGAPEPSKEGT